MSAPAATRAARQRTYSLRSEPGTAGCWLGEHLMEMLRCLGMHCAHSLAPSASAKHSPIARTLDNHRGTGKLGWPFCAPGAASDRLSAIGSHATGTARTRCGVAWACTAGKWLRTPERATHAVQDVWLQHGDLFTRQRSSRPGRARSLGGAALATNTATDWCLPSKALSAPAHRRPNRTRPVYCALSARGRGHGVTLT